MFYPVHPSSLSPFVHPTFPNRFGIRIARSLFFGLLVIVLGFSLIFGLERMGVPEALGSSQAVPQFQSRPVVTSSSVVNGREYQGDAIACDFPAQLHMENVGSKVDGAGMCVMTSIEMSALWAGLDQMRGLRDWCAHQSGGAYPSKVDQQLKAFCASKKIAVPAYLQYEGSNPEPILDQLSKSGRMASVTYGYSPRYGHTIAHMICCPHFSDRLAVCMDNNFIGGNNKDHLYEWMSREEFVKRIKHPSGSAWIFAWLAPGPPPVPHNTNSQQGGECELHGPYLSRLVALDKADTLRAVGYRCEVYQQGLGRWYVKACK